MTGYQLGHDCLMTRASLRKAFSGMCFGVWLLAASDPPDDGSHGLSFVPQLVRTVVVQCGGFCFREPPQDSRKFTFDDLTPAMLLF
jgi:hypothetical protein